MTPKTVALVLKTKYTYYLANGRYIEYFLSPDSGIAEVIERIVSDYYIYCHYKYYNDFVFVRPEIASILIKEVMSRQHMLDNIPHPVGMEVLKLHTAAGPVTVIAKPDMEWPIFMGSEQELKDNSFNACMEEILL
jgi:hypothetical protein